MRALPTRLCSFAMLATFCWEPLAASGVFQFSETSTTVRISGHTEPVGDLVIPGHINGKPVTEIGYEAFKDCTGLTSVAMPSTLTTISHAAFWGCTGLTAVSMPESLSTIRNNAFYVCTNLRDCPLPSGLTSLGTNVFVGCSELTQMKIPSGITSIPWATFFGCSGLTSVTIPDTVTLLDTNCFYQCHGLKRIDLPGNLNRIASGAFDRCSGLESISIPAGVTAIGDRAFERCSGLGRAVFQGDAPTLQASVFNLTAPDFAVYFFEGATGFSTPTWEGYPAVNMGDPTPLTTWLTRHGHAHDASLHDDMNNDGVPLLLAYALGLDPNLNLAGSMPHAVLDPGVMTMTFHAGADGITYLVETSTNMIDWSSSGVTISDPDPDGHRTASVPVDAAARYLRLTVSH